MKFDRIGSLAVGAVIALCASGGVSAQGYPAKPVRIIVPFEVGGTLDTMTRVITPKLTESWGQQVIVDNRAGAGGNIGAQAAARSSADGYTILVHTPSFAVNLSLHKDPGFNPVKDFAPVSLLASTNGVLLIPPSLPVKSVKELIALARAKPGQLSYASTGNGTAGHLNMELFRNLTGIEVVHVPYKSISQAQTDLMVGRVQLWITSLPGAVPHIKSGRMRALAVSGAKRSSGVPDVPTMQEAGVASYEAISWYGMFAPAGTPKELIGRIHADVVRVLKTPEAAQRFMALGLEPIGSTPEFMANYLQQEIARWAKVVKTAGLRAD